MRQGRRKSNSLEFSSHCSLQATENKMDSHKRNWAVASGEGVTEESLLVSRCSLRSVVDLADFGVGVFFASDLMPPAVEVVG